ncbi:ABC transporter permease [candidate division KSB1 bacterium]
MKGKNPPKFAYKLLSIFSRSSNKPYILGDLEENYADIAKRKGVFIAGLWYYYQAIVSLPGFIYNRFFWSSVMLKNYLKISYRNILKKKRFSLINISGLTVGMAACLLILQYVVFEKSYDNFHKNGENIYRLIMEKFVGSHGAAGKAVKETFPEVLEYVKLNKSNSEGIYSYNEKKFREEKVFFATGSFFKVFTFNLILGNPETALSNVNTVVLTESSAKKYFGDEDPIGKIIKFRAIHNLKITGIVEDVPENSHFHFDMLVSFDTLIRIRGEWIETTWTSCPFYTYLLLQQETDIKKFHTKLDEFFTQKEKEISTENKEEFNYRLQPIKNIHLYSNFDFEIEENGSANTMYFLLIIAFFILAIAWINYTNLYTARFFERAKEIEIRKVAGAFRTQLILQLFVESMFFNIIGIFFAIIISQIFLPYFNQLSGNHFSFRLFDNIRFFLLLVSMFLTGTLVSSIYPVFVLSSFSRGTALPGKFNQNFKKRNLSKCLVVFQFASSVALIAGTLTVYSQVSFMKSRDLGVNIDRTIILREPGIFNQRSSAHLLVSTESFKNEVMRIPAVKNAAASTFVPGENVWVRHDASKMSSSKEIEKEFRIVAVDNNFTDFYEFEFISGRDFSKDFRTDLYSVIINEAALNLFNFENPEDAINKRIKYSRAPDPLKIIGVIKNYNQESLKYDYTPLLFLRLLWRSKFSLKIDTHDISSTISSVQDIWNRIFPGNPFEYYFLDEQFNRQYHADLQFGKIFGVFAFLAIFISCLGLFGLSSYFTVMRTKEIGIRKVFGATALKIMVLFIKDFILLITIAVIIAMPFAYLYFDKWLLNYAFRINIGYWFFLFPVISIMFIALSTISIQTLKAARANPVESLRQE